MRGWKNIFHANGKQKKAGVAIFISDKIDLKIKNITRDKERYYMLIKWSIQKEDITIVNIYAPSTGAPQYIRQTLTDIKGEIDGNTIIVGGFNTPLTPMDRSSKQKINKETQVFNDQFSSVQFSSVAQWCQTLVTPWTAAHQASLSITTAWSLLKLISIESVMPFQPSHPLLSPFPPALNVSQHQGLFK